MVQWLKYIFLKSREWRRLRCAIVIVLFLYSLTWDTEHIPVSSSTGGSLSSWWILSLWNNPSELELQRKFSILKIIKMTQYGTITLKCNFTQMILAWNTHSWGTVDLPDTAQTPAPLEICIFHGPPYLLLTNSTSLIQNFKYSIPSLPGGSSDWLSSGFTAIRN